MANQWYNYYKQKKANINNEIKPFGNAFASSLLGTIQSNIKEQKEAQLAHEKLVTENILSEYKKINQPEYSNITDVKELGITSPNAVKFLNKILETIKNRQQTSDIPEGFIPKTYTQKYGEGTITYESPEQYEYKWARERRLQEQQNYLKNKLEKELELKGKKINQELLYKAIKDAGEMPTFIPEIEGGRYGDYKAQKMAKDELAAWKAKVFRIYEYYNDLKENKTNQTFIEEPKSKSKPQQAW